MNDLDADIAFSNGALKAPAARRRVESETKTPCVRCTVGVARGESCHCAGCLIEMRLDRAAGRPVAASAGEYRARRRRRTKASTR